MVDNLDWGGGGGGGGGGGMWLATRSLSIFQHGLVAFSY